MKPEAIRKSNDVDSTSSADLDVYFSARDLAQRWRCSRTTAQRIAKRVGFTRVLLGEGKNGIVRYIRSEIEEYEASRSVDVIN